MRRSLFQFLSTVILFLTIGSPLTYSQAQRGKISGYVFDAVTGEPLMGVNVLVEQTSLGATTDSKGKFIILNVPIGLQSVTARYIGYALTTVNGIEINIDRTTEISFALKPASVTVNQVVVLAQRPNIIKDQTSSTATLNEDQIKAAPIEGVRGMLDLAADLQRTNTGNFSIRGSGAYEVNFQINGVEQMTSATNAPGSFGTEKSNNSWKFDVNPLGVQQLQLITGGFSAEYGNAQAGVVKVVLKDGSPQLKGEVRMEYRPPGLYHFGEYMYSQNSYEWQKWGDLNNWMAQRNVMISSLKLDTRYDALYKKITNRTATHSDSVYWNNLVDNEITWAHSIWVKNHTPADDNPLGVYDYRQYGYNRFLIGIGGPLGKDPNLLKFYFSGEYRKNPTRLPTPEKNQIYQNYILNVSSQPITGHKFKLMASFQKYRGGIWSGSEDIRWAGLAFSPPGLSTKYYVTTDPVRTELTIAQSINWVYTIDARSFVEATFSHQQERYYMPYEYLAGTVSQADRLDSLRDASGTILLDGPWGENFYYRQPFNFSTNYYQDTRTQHYSFLADYTSQITDHHLIKTGLRAYYWDLFNNGVNSSFLANSFLTRTGYAEYYHAYPYSFSIYAQDKFEYEGMIANIGLRAEGYNFQRGVPVDQFNVFYQGLVGSNYLAQPGNPETKTSDFHYIIMPRFGASFPIGEQTAFRIQYGHFASMPIFSHALSNRTQNGWTGMGNANLEPKRTINYEFGLQQVLDENHRLDIAIYYNDRSSQIGLQRIDSYTGSNERSYGFTDDGRQLFLYTIFANNVFGSTQGIGFTFETIQRGNWSYRLSYNISRTSSGTYGDPYLFPENYRRTIETANNLELLSGDDRMHNFRAFLQYQLFDDEGYSLFGTKIFQNAIFSLTYTVQSGMPYTYVTDFTFKDVRYNRRYPLETSFDLNFTKTIAFSHYNLLIGLRVMNLLNNKWLTPPGDFSSDDLSQWVEQGVTIADSGTDPMRPSHIAAPFKAFRNMPRQIFFTLGFGF